MIKHQPKPPYDLFSLAFKADPFPTFAAMRRHHPIYAHVSPAGVKSWYITRFEDVLAVLKDDIHFAKDLKNCLAPEQRQKKRPSSWHQRINENMLFSDPPDHTRLRALVNQAFTPRRSEEMAGEIQIIADDLLDQAQNRGLPSRGVGEASTMDIITRFALPLPVQVICRMLGIPEADQAQVAEWSQAIISPGSRGLSSQRRRQKMRLFVSYLQQMFISHRQQPQDDLVSALVSAEADGDKLSEEELSSMVALLLVTGHETTVNLIGNGTLALLQNPDQLAILRDKPSLWPLAVEELLRYDGPVETSTTRWVRADCDFKGHSLKRGEIVRVVLASANRDDTLFKNPNQLEICQNREKHLAFGHGIHYCLGAPLARLEGIISLRSLFTRFPSIRLDCQPAELKWRSGILFRGLDQLPVSW